MEGPAIMEAYLGVGISLGEESDSALADDGFRSETTVMRANTTARPARKYLQGIPSCKQRTFVHLRSVKHHT